MKNPMNTQEMKERLNAACVEGIEILRIVRLPDNAGNAMASVAAASYTAAMKQDETVRQAGVSLSGLFLPGAFDSRFSGAGSDLHHKGNEKRRLPDGHPPRHFLSFRS